MPVTIRYDVILGRLREQGSDWRDPGDHEDFTDDFTDDFS